MARGCFDGTVFVASAGFSFLRVQRSFRRARPSPLRFHLLFSRKASELPDKLTDRRESKAEAKQQKSFPGAPTVSFTASPPDSAKYVPPSRDSNHRRRFHLCIARVALTRSFLVVWYSRNASCALPALAAPRFALEDSNV